MHRSLAAGRRSEGAPNKSLADALAVAIPGERTFEIVREAVDDVLLVSETEIVEAVRLLANEQKLVVEGGGAVGVAALLAGKIDGSRPLICAVSGGNILPKEFAIVFRVFVLLTVDHPRTSFRTPAFV